MDGAHEVGQLDVWLVGAVRCEALERHRDALQDVQLREEGLGEVLSGEKQRANMV